MHLIKSNKKLDSFFVLGVDMVVKVHQSMLQMLVAKLMINVMMLLSILEQVFFHVHLILVFIVGI
jgi:hypothetical protein